jgi:hypothetical protein
MRLDLLLVYSFFFRKKVIRPGFIEKAIIGFELGLPVLQATQEGGI